MKLLWIDDDLFRDLTERRMSVLMDDDLDLHFAGDATDAYYRLIDKENKYDAVLFDLQHPAGPDDMWNPYREKGERRYGVILLKLVRANVAGKFDHLKNTRFGVFSIEPKEANRDLFENPAVNLPEENYMVKTQALDDDTFLDFIKNLKPFVL